MDESRTIRIYGASDDLVEIEGNMLGDPDEIDCFGERVVLRVESPSEILSEGEPGQMLVVVEYANHGCWMIGLCQTEENLALPNWGLEWSTSGYSVVLSITGPIDMRVVEEGSDAEDL